MAITGTIVEYVVVVHLARESSEERRRCPTAEVVDELRYWVLKFDGGLEYFTVVRGPDGLEEVEGFMRALPPGSTVYRTEPCPHCGRHSWWPKPAAGKFEHSECVPAEEYDYEEDE